MLRSKVGPLLLLIVTIAAVLRLLSIGRGSLFYDEIWHMELSTGRGSAHLRLPVNELVPPQPNPVMLESAPPWYAIGSHMDGVIHPPFYHYTLRIWRSLVGQSGPEARGWSVVCSILAILILFDIVRRQLDVATALWSCAIMAVSGSQVMLAQDVRGYPLLMLLGLLACAATLRIEQAGISAARLIGLGAAALAMLLTHYFAAFTLPAIAFYALIRFRGKARWAVPGVLVLAGLIFLLIWGPTLWAQSEHVADSADIFLKEPAAGRWQTVLLRLASEPMRLLSDSQWQGIWVTAAGLAIGLLVAFRARNNPGMLFWVIWLGCIILPVAGLDLFRETRHLSFIRYTMLASPAICVVLGAGCGCRRPILQVAVLLVCLFGLRHAYPTFNPQLKSLAQFLDNDAKPQEPLIFVSPNPDGRDGQTLYLGLSLYSHLFPRPIVCLTQPANPALLAQLAQGESALIVCPVFGFDPGLVLPGCEVIQRQSFAETGEALRVRLRQ